jgi:ABC-2 type transport system permease protein
VAGATLAGAGGLAWRLHRPALLGWAVGAMVLGFIVGSLASRVADAVGNFPPSIQAVLRSLAHGGRSDLIGTFIAAIAVLVGLLAAAAGIQGVLGAREDEAQGRAESVLATPVSRPRWLLAFVGVGALSVLVVLLGTAAATLGSFLGVGDPENGWRAVGQLLVQAPAALTFVGIAALAVGLLPRISVGLAWGLFGVASVIGLLGGLLRLPDWVLNASPLTSVPAVPFAPMGDAIARLGLVSAIAILLVAAGAALVRRRSVPA